LLENSQRAARLGYIENGLTRVQGAKQCWAQFFERLRFALAHAFLHFTFVVRKENICAQRNLVRARRLHRLIGMNREIGRWHVHRLEIRGTMPRF